MSHLLLVPLIRRQFDVAKAPISVRKELCPNMATAIVTRSASLGCFVSSVNNHNVHICAVKGTLKAVGAYALNIDLCYRMLGKTTANDGGWPIYWLLCPAVGFPCDGPSL